MDIAGAETFDPAFGILQQQGPVVIDAGGAAPEFASPGIQMDLLPQQAVELGKGGAIRLPTLFLEGIQFLFHPGDDPSAHLAGA